MFHRITKLGENMKMYQELAKYIDMTYINKDYRKEVRFIIQMFRKHRIKPKLIYDVACGSGSHSKLLMKAGYNVIGIDLHEGMIRLAKKLGFQVKHTADEVVVELTLRQKMGKSAIQRSG